MKRASLLSLLLALTLVAAGDERVLESFRLRKDPIAKLRGWILSYDDDGFVYERFGDRGRTKLKWKDLVPEDAVRIRRRFGLEMTEDEKKGLVPGHEIRFVGGASILGRVVSTDEESGRIHVKRRGHILPYPKERIREIVERKVPDVEIFTKNELYLRRFERTPPTTATQHRDLADYMYEIGNFAKAARHYEEAIAMKPVWRDELAGRRSEVKELLRNERIMSVVRHARANAFIRGRFEEAIAELELYARSHEEGRRIVYRTLDEIREKWHERRAARFRFVKHEEFDDTVDDYLRRRQPELGEARSWAKSELPKLLERRVMERMGLTEEEYEALLEVKGEGALHHAGYHSGSFVVSSRAKKGTSSARQIRGDPDRWWRKYNEVSSRKNWLKAYAAERLPDIFEVVRIRHDDCGSCGSRGYVEHQSIHSTEAAGHEWKQLCPRCFGAQQDRSVSYR